LIIGKLTPRLTLTFLEFCAIARLMRFHGFLDTGKANALPALPARFFLDLANAWRFNEVAACDRLQPLSSC